MEEELNENDLEDRLYAMLHHVDETQANVSEHSSQNESARAVEPSTVRRYWRDPLPQQRYNNTLHKVSNPHLKINTPTSQPTVNNKQAKTPTEKTKPKEEQSPPPEPPQAVDLSVFQSTPPQNLHKSIEILDNEDQVLEVESSDEDEVIEVALPPKPTITIESSDEEEPQPKVTSVKPLPTPEKGNGDRAVSASPVPSIVSSVSDDFIRGDCIALNISSRRADNHSFDFSLHGSDLLGQDTPSKKKKRKRNKENASTSLPAMSTPAKQQEQTATEECFATPKSKSKNKKQKKSYVVNDKSLPNADIYDSDSNQSIIDTNKTQQSYVVTEKSLPSADVYESDSSQPEFINNINRSKQSNPNNNKDESTSDESINCDADKQTTDIINKQNDQQKSQKDNVIDLTDNAFDNSIVDTTLDNTIKENLVMANVTGFEECHAYSDTVKSQSDTGKFGSTKIPAILYADLDFDNLKGNDRVCSKRRYSLTTLRAEMEKFYNDSWGGEDFNHREIQKNMSRDKSLWMIDPKDRMPSLAKRKVTCNYCNRAGHRDDKCRVKPPICYMCGSTGHYEPRCPAKICVNCGSPNQMYSSMCRNCSGWGGIWCAECGQRGHPASHCPDLWRRYHNTVDENAPMEECHVTKKYNQMFCSGCTRRGHLVHTCRVSIPFSGLTINSPYVFAYNPIYSQTQNNDYNQNHYRQQFRNSQDSTILSTISNGTPRNKRQSKSPTVHETHVNKKRNVSESTEFQTAPKSPNVNRAQRKMSGSKDLEDNNKSKDSNTSVNTQEDPNKMPDFIPIGSSNHDKRGQMIQDNEVSDTSDVITSARIYVTNEIIDKLKMDEGKEWLNAMMTKHEIAVETTDVNSFISIRGKLGDQEAFQSELRDWTRSNIDRTDQNDLSLNSEQSPFCENIPKNRFNLLRKITKALASLKEDIGDPKAIYKELTYLQNRHVQLLNCKVINPKQLSNNRNNINTALKKLNMVLLGQAGLADGSQHLIELTSLHQKLCNLRQKNISSDVREEIGQHYHTIFSASPREDYSELVQKYYGSNQSPNSFKKKKKNKLSKITPKLHKKSLNTIPSPIKNPAEKNEVQPESQKGSRQKPQVKKSFGKLVFLYQRLLRSKPNDTVLKKTRVELVRKLHTQISSLSKATALSSKTMKKTRKIQEQARTFLKNV